jgi:SAM-dependent methyltransferase
MKPQNARISRPVLRSQVSLSGYLRGDLFRIVQDSFVRSHGRAWGGSVVEIGGESKYGHSEMFPCVESFRVTNVGRGESDYLDVTSMEFPDESQETFLCVSVLEHVDDISGAFAEISRTLRPGGHLILTIPFLYPVHDTHDAWRVSRDGFESLLGDSFQIEVFEHLGGRISTIAALLQRPIGKWSRRYIIPKLFGAAWVAVMGRFDQLDDSPLGYGLIARRIS